MLIRLDRIYFFPKKSPHKKNKKFIIITFWHKIFKIWTPYDWFAWLLVTSTNQKKGQKDNTKSCIAWNPLLLFVLVATSFVTRQRPPVGFRVGFWECWSGPVTRRPTIILTSVIVWTPATTIGKVIELMEEIMRHNDLCFFFPPLIPQKIFKLKEKKWIWTKKKMDIKKLIRTSWTKYTKTNLPCCE